jgi:hypothetical protein
MGEFDVALEDIFANGQTVQEVIIIIIIISMLQSKPG